MTADDARIARLRGYSYSGRTFPSGRPSPTAPEATAPEATPQVEELESAPRTPPLPLAHPAASGAPHADADFLSVAQVAKRLGCSVSLVQKWRRLGWLPATRLGPPEVPVYGYRPADVDRFALQRWNRKRGRPRLHPPRDQRHEARPAPSKEHAGDPEGQDRSGRAAGQAGRSSSLWNTTAFLTHPSPDEVQEPRAPETPIPAAMAPMAARRAPRREPPHVHEAGGGAEVWRARPRFGSPAALDVEREAHSLPSSGRPLRLWAGDPREMAALVLARFPASELAVALRVAAAWLPRYDELALGEVDEPAPGARAPHPWRPPTVRALWRKGERVPLEPPARTPAPPGPPHDTPPSVA